MILQFIKQRAALRYIALGIELGWRWSDEAVQFLLHLVAAWAAPAFPRAAVRSASVRGWSALLTHAVMTHFALFLLGAAPGLAPAEEPAPTVGQLLADAVATPVVFRVPFVNGSGVSTSLGFVQQWSLPLENSTTPETHSVHNITELAHR